MARAGGPSPGTPLLRHNIRLDSFLKRNTRRATYERIRTCEPCVVKTDSINKVYMHVVLSDERVYLTEYPPRTLVSAFTFSSVRAIELIKDLPEFLSEKDRLRCQHIKITFVPAKPASQEHSPPQSNDPLFPVLPPSRSSSSLTSEGYSAHSSPTHTSRSTRSASCPNAKTLGLLMPHPPTRPHSSASMYPLTSDEDPKTVQSPKVPRRIGLWFSRLLNRNKETNVAELHLYALSPSSTLYLHLQSIWTNFNMKSTLMLDPLYSRRYSCPSSVSSTEVISFEQTARRFSQLETELLQEGISMERCYLLLQELCTAAHRNTAIRRLFWRSSELCLSLVQTLEDCLHGDQGDVCGTDRLLMRTVIVQTLAIMFQETEMEPARLCLLSANNGACVARIILALICDAATSDCPQMRGFHAEYLDAACALVFELIRLGHEKSRFSGPECVLSLGWILKVLQRHPQTLSFLSYQAQQLVSVLSSSQQSSLSPVQSVLLFQRCRLLLVCLQYSTHLTQHLKSSFREDFRYSIKVSSVETKLPPHYPIRPMVQSLVKQIRALILV